MDIHNEPVAYKKGAAYLGAGFTIPTIFDDHIGSLKAVDPVANKIVWEYKNKAPLWGGVLTTAGGPEHQAFKLNRIGFCVEAVIHFRQEVICDA